MPISDVNQLFAAPWPLLQAQLVQQVRSSLTGLSVENDNLTTSATIKYHLSARLDDAQLQANTLAPPGFEELSQTSVRAAVPLDPAGWSLELTGNVNGFIDVRGIGIKFLSKTFQNELQQISLSGIRVVADIASADFNADLPQLTGVQLFPTLQLVLTGFVNGTFVLNALDTVTDPNSALQFQADIAHLQITGVVNAEINGTVTLTLGETLSAAFAGRVTAGSLEVPVTISKEFPLPQSVGEALGLINSQQTWGEGRPQPADPILPSMNFSATAQAVEEAIEEHLPYGAIFDSIFPAPLQPCSPPPRVPQNYYGEDDSAIWTGHYLAAEAFRYAVASQQADAGQQAAALQRVNQVLDGIDLLFRVPEQATIDAAGGAGTLTGLFCRAVLPDDAPVQTTVPLNAPAPQDKHNYYGPVTLGNTVWYGLGRDDDPPSRDSYTGLMLGFACAYHLINDAAVQARIQDRVTALLEYLLAHDWNVPTPTGEPITVGADGGIETQVKTSFLFQFHQQLAFLRVGKTVNAAQFGGAYDAAAQAADFAWLPIWGDCLEPIGKYYKFNLDHACLGILLLLEDDANVRGHYMRAFQMLRKTIGHHRNAYFNLWWVLANPSAASQQAAGSAEGVTLAAETWGLLNQWFERTMRVPGENCSLMRKETPSVVYLTHLDPQADLGLYHEFGQPDPIVLSQFALSVQYRPGRDLDFCWQRPPFLTGLSLNAQGQIDFTSLDLGQVVQEAPGIDFLLPYWMAAYLNLPTGS